MDLHALVEEIAAAGGLCLSQAHVQELVVWHLFVNADMADWLDSFQPK